MAGVPTTGHRLTPEWIEKVRQASDIVTVVGERVRLKRSGQGFVGLCPFHQERTPSFHVHPQRQFFHCFGCGAGGDVFAFIMKSEGLSFPEAVLWLARRAGIPEQVMVAGRGTAEDRWIQSLFQAQEWAVRWFERMLSGAAGAEGRAYLQRRGVKPQVAAAFRLGYAPAQWDALVTQARRDGVPLPLLGKLGLVAQGRDGRWWDRFRHRLIFPILDASGRPLAVGGRRLGTEENEPKYLNSPESPIYHKGREWYGLHVTRAAIRHRQKAVVVEGYMDCIALFQAGVAEVAASLGTSLTRLQVARLARDARQVVVAYDADIAGRLATVRAIQLWQQAGVSVMVARWPDGDDPDSLARRDPQAAVECINHAVSAWNYRLELALGDQDIKGFDERLEAVGRVARLLAGVEEQAELEVLIQEAAARLGVTPLALEDEVRTFRQRQGVPRLGRDWPRQGEQVNHTSRETQPSRVGGVDGQDYWSDSHQTAIETAFLGWLIHRTPPWPAWVWQARPEWFQTVLYRRLWEVLMRGVSPAAVQSGQEGPELAGLLQLLRERGVGEKLGADPGRASSDVDELYGQELFWRLRVAVQVQVIRQAEKEMSRWEQSQPLQLGGLNQLLLRHKQISASLVQPGAFGRGAQ